MKIRKAKLKDIEQITNYGIKLISYHQKLDSYFAVDKGAKDCYRKIFKKSIYSKNSNLLVAEKDGKIIGYALGGMHPRLSIFKIKKIGSVNDMFVEEKFRKNGISKRFMEELGVWFRSKKIKYVEISVHVKNDMGKKTWAKYGFREYMTKQMIEIDKMQIS